MEQCSAKQCLQNLNIYSPKCQNGEALTAEHYKGYYELNKKYYGEGVYGDEEIGLEWARIPHFYYNYYVYQYATGYSAATALSKQILMKDEPAVERYLIS